jgi:hypothetical protein
MQVKVGVSAHDIGHHLNTYVLISTLFISHNLLYKAVNQPDRARRKRSLEGPPLVVKMLPPATNASTPAIGLPMEIIEVAAGLGSNCLRPLRPLTAMSSSSKAAPTGTAVSPDQRL